MSADTWQKQPTHLPITFYPLAAIHHMIIHSWRHATPSHRIDHDPGQWFPFISPVAHRGGSRLVRVKAAERTYPDTSQGLRLCPPKKSTGSRGKSDCARVLAVLESGKSSSLRTLLLSHTHTSNAHLFDNSGADCAWRDWRSRCTL